MRKYILVILAISLASCTTTNLTEEEILDIDILTVTTESKENRVLSDEDELCLEQFRTFALEGADLLSFVNKYKFSSLTILDSPTKAKEVADNILNSSWSVSNREEYLIRINNLYLGGMRSRYINILNNLLLKKELLYNSELLLKQETWQEEIDNETITLEDFQKIVYLISRADYTSFIDMHLFELERLSTMIRWGYAMDYITEKEAFAMLEDLATEMSNFDYTWLDWGSSYVAGLTMLWYDSYKMDMNINNRSMGVLNLLNNYSWSKSNWDTLQELSVKLRANGVITDDNLFRDSVKPPKLPRNIEVDPIIEKLFDPERKSQSYVESYRYNFDLYEAVISQDTNNIKNVLDNHLEEIKDIQIHTGCGFVYEAVSTGNVESVKLLLKAGLNPNLQNTGNWSFALDVGVSSNNFEIVKLLLEHGADPNLYSKVEVTALGSAINNQNLEIINLLLQYGANPLVGIYNGDNPTFWGAFRKEDRQIGLSILHSIEDKTVNAMDAYTSLLLLLKANRQEEFKLLLSKTSDMEYRTEEGDHILYESGRKPEYNWASEILIDLGFSMELPGYNNFSYLGYLAYSGNYEQILYVIDRGYDMSSYDNNTGLPIAEHLINNIKDKETQEYLTLLEGLKERGIEP